MYDTRWPRPGPAMAAVAAVLGLVAGIVLGLSSRTPEPQAEASPPAETTVAPATTTLPDQFHTVVLGSYNDRANADARLREVREMGIKDVGILERGDYELRTAYAVYSGQFDTEEEAQAHYQELAGYGIPPSGRFVRDVRRVG
jgi:negative regulator of sigma E activity